MNNNELMVKSNDEEIKKTRYYTILTKIGKVSVSNAIVLNEKVDFAYIALGDGGGKEYDPVESQTELKGKRTDNIKIHNIIAIEENAQIEIQAIIGQNIGGFTVREVGIYDSKGNLLAISKIAERTKPMISEGLGVDMFFKLKLEVSNTSIINITVDPSALLVNINQFNQFKGEVAKEFEKFKDEVNKALAGGELEEIIINIKDDLDKHIEDSITNSDIHGMTLVDEELYRKTDKGNIPIKIEAKNIKNLSIPKAIDKASQSDIDNNRNIDKYINPYQLYNKINEIGKIKYDIFFQGNQYEKLTSDSSDWSMRDVLSIPSDKAGVIRTEQSIDVTSYNYLIVGTSVSGSNGSTHLVDTYLEISTTPTGPAIASIRLMSGGWTKYEYNGAGYVAHLPISNITGKVYIRVKKIIDHQSVYSYISLIELSKEMRS